MTPRPPRPRAALLSAMLSAALAAALAAPLPALAAPTGTAGGPMALIRNYNKKLDAELKRKADSGELNRVEIKRLAGELFDYKELGRRSLGSNWDKLTSQQREDFIATLREMIEKNYVRQLRTNLDYEVDYKDEAVTGDEATVSSVVKIRTRGKSTDALIDYKLHKVDGAWRVFDVITDEVSMVRNYRQQFNKIISQESYDALLQKMRKRIAEMSSEKSAESAAK